MNISRVSLARAGPLSLDVLRENYRGQTFQNRRITYNQSVMQSNFGVASKCFIFLQQHLQMARNLNGIGKWNVLSIWNKKEKQGLQMSFFHSEALILLRIGSKHLCCPSIHINFWSNRNWSKIAIKSCSILTLSWKIRRICLNGDVSMQKHNRLKSRNDQNLEVLNEFGRSFASQNKQSITCR